MELLTACGLGKRNIMPKKSALTIKITEYIQTTLLSAIVPEDLALIFDTNLSTIKRILKSLEKKNLIKQSDDIYVRI